MGTKMRRTLVAMAMVTVAGCLPYPVSRVTELQDTPMIAALPLSSGPIAPASTRIAPRVVFDDPGHGRGDMTVVLPDGRHFRGGFTVIDQGWRGPDYPQPGPGHLHASLRNRFETMECRLAVQDRTVLAAAGVGSCALSDGSTTSVMW